MARTLVQCPILVLSLAAFLGCSSGTGIDGTVPVKGTVNYNGQPVSGATVTFIGDGNARGATAITGADGSYELATLDTKGALPGNYRVVVDKTEMPPELKKDISMEEAAANADKPTPAPKKLLPEIYSDPARTPLKFEVKAGEEKYNIELKDA